MKRTTLLCLVSAFLGSGLALAQATTGGLRILVEAQDGSALSGVAIEARSPEALGTRTAISDAAGVATLAGLDPSAAYVVTATLDGFSAARFENVLVKAGHTTTLRSALTLAPVEAQIEVVAQSPTIDFTSAISGQDITLELTESLPTGRTYQSYLQLVPGVLPTDPSIADENPAVRSGLNYSDRGGESGRSRDNLYYIDGIDVTDRHSGFFGADLNTEIIQEQSVMTGGIPAEFPGAPGLVSNVLTKSGGNDLHGTVNYYFQSDALVAENEHAEAAGFSTYDTALTLGGPIARDEAWFFASYRLVNREEQVSSLETGQYMRTVTSESDQGFAKLSWSPISSAKVTATFLSDPTETDGQILRDVSNNRDRTEKTGGSRYILDYSHVLGPVFLSLSAGKHNGEQSEYPANAESRNDIVFNLADSGTFTTEDEQLGGYGVSLTDERDNELVEGELEWYLGTGWGDHTISLGAGRTKHERLEDRALSGGARYLSLHPRYSGLSLSELLQGRWTIASVYADFSLFYPDLLRAIDSSPGRDMHYAILDLNRDGTITRGELDEALVFVSSSGNPHGAVNFQRILQATFDPAVLTVKGTTLYLQDSFQRKRLTINAGVRAEQWRHFATTGAQIADFDFELSPRLGVIYDLFGDGRQKLSAFYGRYYDPIRLNMTAFAGRLTGAITEVQYFITGEWLTTSVSGGVQDPLALFAPATKTPYTDDYQIGYQVELGRNMTLEALAIKRRTRDLMEDYDLCLYAYCADGTSHYPGPIDHPDSLWLGLGYFGYESNPGSDYVIANLAGGKRDWEGLELIFRKRYSNRWQLLASYSYADASGNTNSDSDADFQGDFLFLDPRAPGQHGRQPGTVEHLFKVAGSYQWANGLQVGGSFRFSSGTVASRTWSAFSRNLPIAEVGQYAGITSWWIADDAMGSLDNPSWGCLDLRAQYRRDFGRFHGELFVDIFNALDDQAAVRNQDLVAGTPAADFGEAIQWLPPRRFYLGVRLGF